MQASTVLSLLTESRPHTTCAKQAEQLSDCTAMLTIIRSISGENFGLSRRRGSHSLFNSSNCTLWRCSRCFHMVSHSSRKCSIFVSCGLFDDLASKARQGHLSWQAEDAPDHSPPVRPRRAQQEGTTDPFCAQVMLQVCERIVQLFDFISLSVPLALCLHAREHFGVTGV